MPVSVPIWREEVLDMKGANVWTIHNLHKRLADLGGDNPWADYAKTLQIITAQMRHMLSPKWEHIVDNYHITPTDGGWV